MDDPQFRKLLDFFGLSWKGYRRVRKGVQKRVGRYMLEHGFRNLEPFLAALEKDEELRKQVEQLMTVSISRFFRDRKLWQALGKYVLPEITTRGEERIKVWSAGCARGEEVYSFKILWEEWKGIRDRVPELEVWATDVNPEFLERARWGVYSVSSLKELPEELRTKYFRPANGSQVVISDSLKEGILWKVHNLLAEDPPASGFEIIFLRNNLLTYYKEDIQRAVIFKVIHGLRYGGFLIIGAHEKLPTGIHGLNPFPQHRNIFQKES